MENVLSGDLINTNQIAFCSIPTVLCDYIVCIFHFDDSYTGTLNPKSKGIIIIDTHWTQWLLSSLDPLPDLIYLDMQKLFVTLLVTKIPLVTIRAKEELPEGSVPPT